MFKEENALPRSKLHVSVGNRQCLARARQSHADVRWHVIAAFGAVREVIGILRHQVVEELLQIAARSWIGIFHDDDAATGVLNKNCRDPVSKAASVDLRLNFIGDFVETFSVAGDFELIVINVHSKRTKPECMRLSSRAAQTARDLTTANTKRGLSRACYESQDVSVWSLTSFGMTDF